MYCFKTENVNVKFLSSQISHSRTYLHFSCVFVYLMAHK
jgi:hypothetical protein